MNDYTDIHFGLIDQKGTIKNVGTQNFKVPKQGISQGTLFIEIDKVLLESDKTKVQIGVYNGDKLIETTSTNFLGPRSFN
jgi:hypothetical protein